MIADLALSDSVRWLVLGLVFLVIVGAIIVVVNFTASRSAVRGRLEDVTGTRPNHSGSASLRGENVQRGWAKLAESIEKTGISLVDTKSDSLRAKLIAAGYNSPAAPKIFTLIRLILVVVLPGILVATSFLNAAEISPLKLYLYGVGMALFGLYLPNLWVAAKADRRKQAIINGFPDCLDLMLVCVEAGLGIEAAFDRVGKEMVHSHPLVARMLSTATLELRAGATREEALRHMADRSNVDEIRSFSTLLIQSDKLGSSIGETLRVYAAEMREKRRLRAEEKAHRLPVLLSIPLVTCLLPVMIGVLMLPAAVRVVREIFPALGAG